MRVTVHNVGLATFKPKFEINGLSNLNVKQESHGKGWLQEGINCLAQNETLLAQVIPSNQFFESDYVGIFHFRFWQYGSWYDVVIDDFLPFSRLKNQLVFAHNTYEPNEFWMALLVN